MTPRRREGPVFNPKNHAYYLDSYIGFPPNHKRVRLSLRTRDPVKARWLWEQEYRRQWEKYYGIPGGTPPSPAPIFEDIAREFIAYERNVKRISEWKMYERRLNIVGSFWKDKTLDEIGSVEIQEIDTWLADHGREKYTRNHYMALLKALFNFAIREKYFSGRNPVKEFRPYIVDSNRREYTEDELRRILEAAGRIETETQANARAPKYARRIILMLLLTGMRLGELLNLKWDNVRGDRIVLRRTETKQKREKTIPLTPGIEEILASLKLDSCGDGYVLPIENRKTRVEVKWLIRRVREISGVSDFILHGLRHTAASIMVSESLGRGVGLQDIMNILGHNRTETLMKYQHDDFSRMKKAMETLESRIKK